MSQMREECPRCGMAIFNEHVFLSFVIHLQLHPVDNLGGDHYLAKLSLCCQSVSSLQKRFV